MKMRFLLTLLPLLSVATLHAGSFRQSFCEAPFVPDESIIGLNGWTLRSASPEFGDQAVMIRSGGPTGASQSLEAIAKGEDATFARHVLTPSLEISASKNNRISVDLLYENPQDFKSGVVYLSVATNAGALNIGLTSGEPGETGVAFVDLGGNTNRVTSPPRTFKAGTWYRFTVGLYQGGAKRSAKITLTPITGGVEAKPVWEAEAEMSKFNPTDVERFDISIARTGRIPVIRVARFAEISVATIP